MRTERRQETVSKSKEDMVKSAVEEAKKAAEEEKTKEEQTEEVQAEETQTEEKGEEKEVSEEKEKTEKEIKAEEKSLFKKKSKKDKKDEKIEDLTDKLARQMAEFDNFRKRSEKEKSAMYEMGAKSVIEKMLPIIDNFERGLKGVAEEQKEDSFVEGMDKIYKQLLTSLEEIGVKPIEAVGQTFNPDLHNAVMHEESEDYEENIISEEFQKGYTYRDTVVRYSMVKVVN